MKVRVRPSKISRSVPRRKPAFLLARFVAAMSCVLAITASAAAQEVVLHSTDVSTTQGNWARTDSSSAASNSRMSSGDHGWAATDAPHANPANYFEATFRAEASTTYRVWLRLRAQGDSKWNDSVWVQFSDSTNSSGSALYRIGTTSAILFNLESCNGCGVGGWGWTGGAWWVTQSATVQFASGGTKTIRVQTREDGVDVDQIVLSASTYRHAAPGSGSHDATVLSRTSGGGGTQATASTSTVRPIPGTIEAEDFDNGANGTAYWDSSAGNNGGQYRATDVDIERCAEGGFNIGWIASGEWVNYTVSVPSNGTYTLEFRVASPGGGSLRAHFNGEDKTGSVAIPSTGGWQSWTTVRRSVNLSAGTQVMRLVFDTGGFNLNYVHVVSGGSSSASGSASATPFGGSAWAIPGTIQTEDFDEGGQGVAYHDHTSGNTGGAYRWTDVDIAATPNGGYTVGWVGAGEWLRYTVNVAAAGHYTLTARVASAGNGGTFHVKFNSEDKTGSMRVPNTGGWETYQDVHATVWLDAGVQAMHLAFDSDGATGAVGNFTYLRLASGSAPAPAPDPAPSGGGRLRVMTWNIELTRDPAGQAQEIADSGAHVVLLQEATRWSEDAPRTFPERLQQLTGHTWHSVWAPHFGRYSEDEGTLILSRLPIVDQSIRRVYDRGFARVLVDVGGVHVNLFSVHLDWYDTSMRSAQLEDFMWWSRQFGGPRLAGGDFNAWWGEWWIRRMTEEHTDTWVDVTGSVENGYTLNGAVRFDYIFRAHQDSWRLTPTAIWVPWTGRSDHYPVIAEYTVR